MTIKDNLIKEQSNLKIINNLFYNEIIRKIELRTPIIMY